MDKPVVDQGVRDELLDTSKSFIVQAPAGSGKTELLTQRILALFCIIDKPENILAITFTNKASAEMQNRVVSALQMGLKPEPSASHEQKRWRLAKQVLQRDKQMNWHLLDNPSRLNIMTFDSFSARLSAALPLLSQTGMLPKIAEDPGTYYDEAIESLLATIDEDTPVSNSLQMLLAHKDNNLNQVSELLTGMLNKRVQWLAPVKNHLEDFSQNRYLDSLKQITTEKLGKLYHSISADIVAELPPLLSQASRVLSAKENGKKQNLEALGEVQAIAKPDYQDLNLWKAIAELLLKANSSEFLSSFDKRAGFPTDKDAANEAEKIAFTTNKQMVTQIAADLKNHPEIGESLYQISLLPDLEDINADNQALMAALTLLPMAVAHLKLVFSRYNVIDFSELLLSSLDALGHADAPSDLALALDYRLQHILIDEFQDTSTPQIELLKLLMAGWEGDANKTLFLVGDPMQSIYRFRDANVSLFMKIRDQGVAGVKPNFRQLKVNFRSDETIVNWVNTHFAAIMPEQDDLDLSAVSYANSVAFNQMSQQAADKEQYGVNSLYTLESADHYLQAQTIVDQVQQHLANNNQKGQKKTLAILARGRNHLKEIIELLNQNNLKFQAHSIDRLDQKIIVSDLVSLTFALLDEYDQTHWFACMRSPWFGLDLQDIRQVMLETENHLPFIHRIKQAMSLMTSDAAQRCDKLIPILTCAIEQRNKKDFHQWLWGTFEAVGGLGQLDYLAEYEDLKTCLDALEKLNAEGQLNDQKAVMAAMSNLYASIDVTADEQVQVMTIHGSKGLEFDTVILPRLDAIGNKSEQELMKWTEVIDDAGKGHTLLAISKETGKEHGKLYRYINYLDNKKSNYELQRLFYVAATRAREKLVLFGNIKADPKFDGEAANDHSSSANLAAYKKPQSGSLLGLLWPVQQGGFDIIPSSESSSSGSVSAQNPEHRAEVDEQPIYQTRYIKRVAIDQIEAVPKAYASVDTDKPQERSTVEEKSVVVLQEAKAQAAAIGTVLHRQLQWISEQFSDDFRLPDNWPEITRSQLKQQYAFDDEELGKSVETVLSGVNKTLSDSWGKIILAAKEDAHSEYCMQKKLEHTNYLTRIIDRTFVYEGKRWIVDYKSSQPVEGESMSDFLEKEIMMYREQMQDYFNLFAKIETLPIVAGLYFPLLSHFEKVITR